MSKLDEATIAKIAALDNSNLSGRAIAEVLGIHHKTVHRYLKKIGTKAGNQKNPAKVLVYDIETSPSISYHWRRWKENISEGQVIQNSYVLTWSAKWLGEPTVFSDSVHLHNKKVHLGKPFDKEVVKSLWELLDEADIIIHQNGDNFDMPTMNSRFVYWGLPPIHPAKQVDTLKIAKKQFRFPSNALDSLAAYLGLPYRKIKTDFSLWRRCMEGDIPAYEDMVEYNMRDVELLEDVYLKLRAFDKQHPNVTLYGDLEEPACGCCGSTNIELTGRHAYTAVSKFATYRCLEQGCGKVSRARKNVLDKEERDSILTNAL